jgi:hypothetical protein
MGRLPATLYPAGPPANGPPDPDPGPGDLPFGLQAQGQHQLLVILASSDRAARLRHPQVYAVMLEQRRHRGVLAAVKGPFVFPITIASHPRSGSASAATSAVARGRRGHASVRLSPASKNSATILPGPDTSAAACPRCRARDVTGSCQSSVDTRP